MSILHCLAMPTAARNQHGKLGSSGRTMMRPTKGLMSAAPTSAHAAACKHKTVVQMSICSIEQCTT